jgi:hypothetical protein
MKITIECRQCTYSNWGMWLGVANYELWRIFHDHRKAVKHTEFMVTLSGEEVEDEKIQEG